MVPRRDWKAAMTSLVMGVSDVMRRSSMREMIEGEPADDDVPGMTGDGL